MCVIRNQNTSHSYYVISAFLLNVFLPSYAECQNITMHSVQYALNIMHYKHFLLLETRWHQPTDQPTDRVTDIAMYRAAITAKNMT